MRAVDVAFLSHMSDMTFFSYGDEVLRFKTSSHLVRYVDVVSWDAGYLVVNAEYDTLGIVEEYIDMVTVMRHLLRDPVSCLAPIKTVEVHYA